MSVHVLFNLFKELIKGYQMRGLLSIFSQRYSQFYFAIGSILT